MIYLCIFKYESTSYLGVSFHNQPPESYPAPGVECIKFTEFPDDDALQKLLLDYLNDAFPGNGKNLFNATPQNIEKLVNLMTSTKSKHQRQSMQSQSLQQSQQQSQSPYMPIGYIIPRPTRNDDSEFARVPVSSFSYANHALSMPHIQQSNEFTFTPAKLNSPPQVNFKPIENSNM